MTVHFHDAAREMFRELSEDESINGCYYAIAIIVKKNAECTSDHAYDDDTPNPFLMIGALEVAKTEVMNRHIEQDG